MQTVAGWKRQKGDASGTITAKFRFLGQKFLFIMVLDTMMIPGQVSWWQG